MTDDTEGLCPVCGRDATTPEACPCCKGCGSINTPCACEFDLSTEQGRSDFFKYGEAFHPMKVLSYICEGEKCGRPVDVPCSRCGYFCPKCDPCGAHLRLQHLADLTSRERVPPPPGKSITYYDIPDGPRVEIHRIVFCDARTQIQMPIDKSWATIRCVLRAEHDGKHKSSDRTWDNVRCEAYAAVVTEAYSPVQCDKPAGHEGKHQAYRGDGLENYRWEWEDASSFPAHIPKAYDVSPKKRSLLSIVREFFRSRRHIRASEPGPKTGGGR